MHMLAHRTLLGWKPLLACAGLLAGCGETGGGAGGTGGASAASAGGAVPGPTPRADVVLVVIDTLRAEAILDPLGRYDTPNLDRLASEGTVFTRTFAHAPMTLPSHTALFSSRPPLETGVFNNRQDVPSDLPLLAEWLASHGYDTRAVTSLGTLNLAEGKPGLRRGFASYDVDFWCIAQAEDTAARIRASLEQRDPEKPLFFFAHYADPHEPYNAHGTELRSADISLDGELLEQVVTSDMTKWIRTLELPPGRHMIDVQAAERFRIRTFEVYLGGRELDPVWELSKVLDRTKAARIAFEVPAVDGSDAMGSCQVKLWISDVPTDPNKPKRYALETAYADRYIGELFGQLRELGLYDRSVIVFTSDHGEALGERNFFGHVDGLTDDQIHVPLIIKLPPGDPRASDLALSAERIVPQVDLVPTLLELVSLPPLPGQRGSSLLRPHDSIHVAETHTPEAKKNQLALRDERFKMIYFVDEERFELYDLERDPGELRDVFSARSGERPDWPERLRSLARAASAHGTGGGEVDEATRRELEALGYGGG
jgi:arylsulfatase A-like enzyme